MILKHNVKFYLNMIMQSLQILLHCGNVPGDRYTPKIRNSVQSNIGSFVMMALKKIEVGFKIN